MIWTGILLGLMSSLHCVGMCGPIALALPVPEGHSRIIAILLYNLGRTITYGFLGLTAGTIGYLTFLSGFQQYLSIAFGASVLIMALISITGYTGIRYHKLTGLFMKLKKKFSILLRDRSLSALFFIGLINGLLPCGMVYIAMIGAVAIGTSFEGGLYMLLFGAGTVPLMFLVSFVKNMKWISWIRGRYVISGVSVVVGTLLILRGLNLGIPYISPHISDEKVTCCSVNKCHKLNN